MRRNTKMVLFCCAAMAMIGSQALAEVHWNVPGNPGRPQVRVQLATQQARTVRTLVRALQTAGVPHYANFWEIAAAASRRAYPNRAGVSIVAAVTRDRAAAWQQRVGDKTIGIMCQGTPTEPHQTGEVRIGDLYFSWRAVNHGGDQPVRMNRYFQSPGNQHVEQTIPVSDREMAAFKTFYLARAKTAIIDRQGNPLVPEFDSYSPTKYSRTGWVEGCSAASTSALDRHWTKAFRQSIDHIRQVGQQQGISELRNADASMADLIEGVAERMGIKQQCSPQGAVRRGVFGGAEQVGMMTILNDANTPSNLLLHNQWDQK
ncbi:MAG: hypothetical protein V1754_07800, partial [Pseudomonadota bacterium]